MKLDLDYIYYESFIDFWIPIYRRQIFKAKFNNDNAALKDIYDNIDKNWYLQNYKDYIFEILNIKYLKR